VIGLGAAGGVAAQVLTEAGLDVVALEAGPRLEAGMMTLDEIRNDIREWMCSPKAMREVPTWRHDQTSVAGPSPWPMLMVNAVGGSAVHYPGLSIRLLPWNFESRTRVIERYGLSAVPTDSTLADWPLRYEELEPYYERVEYAIGVAGQPGNVVGHVDPGGNAFEGARGRGYPMAPLRRSGWNKLTDAAARRLGWHPFPAPAALNSEPYNGNPACTYCGFCSCNGCYLDAKGSPDANAIRRAEATGRLQIETSARVVRLEVDADGLVTGATYVQDWEEKFQAASVVLLGCFTYENTRLLLLSTSKAYPAGLSNNSGQVGKHYMAHVTPFGFGVFPGRRLNLFSGPWSQATCVDDWNADNFDHSKLGFVGGAMLAAPHELKPIATAMTAVPPWVPTWGSGWKAWLKENAQSVGAVSAQFESLSYEGNSLDLDPAARDPFGIPVLRVTHSPGENERKGNQFMRAKLEEWLREAGASETWSTDAVFVEARHCYGGTRMGEDHETSVVDRFGFSYETPNLGVLGTSTFPTTGGHNPTLTVQALAWRTAARLVERFDSLARAA
jgi:gluconate 2-dehydrogenase alpha chain